MKTLRYLALGALFLLYAGAAHSAGRNIYPPVAQARADIAEALHSAAASHKNVLIDFGGDWCIDCVVLDRYFHDARNLPILKANYVLVHVNVGREMNENMDIAESYGIPLSKGVPALAVLSSKGKLLYSQSSGQFNNMSHMDSSAVTRFLIQWKPVKPGCSVVAVNC